jgi:hypothetical protein
MRVALFVVVVAAHIIMLLLLRSTRPLASAAREGEAFVSIFLPPAPEERQQQPEPGGEATPQPPRAHPPRAHRRHAATWPPDSSASSRGEPAQPPDLRQQSAQEPAPTVPDWRLQAGQSAQTIAQDIVAAEDAADRRAHALTSHFKPLPPPRVKGPEFGWDYAATHRVEPLPGGGLAISLNDNCQLVVLPMPFIGCVIGKLKPNGNLFEYMHPPMKFDDWDKRDAQP